MQRRVIRQFSGGARAERADIQLQRVRGRLPGRRFFFHARLKRFAQGRFQLGELDVVFRAQIDFHGGARWNRIDRSAALDRAEIVRTSRIGGHRDRRKLHDSARHGRNRIRRAEIRPAVASRSGDGGFKAPRGDALRGDVIGGRPVNRDDSRETRAVAIHQRAHAAQISFALFAHVADQNNRLRRAHARLRQRPRKARQGREADAVVGNPGREQPAGVALHANFRARRKHGIEMRGEKNHALGVGAGPLRDHVAGLVRADLKSARREQLFQRLPTPRFVEFRRGNFRQANLLVGDPCGAFVNPLQAAGARRIARKFRERIVGCASGERGHP